MWSNVPMKTMVITFRVESQNSNSPINPRREAVDGSSYKELQTRGLMSIGVGL